MCEFLYILLKSLSHMFFIIGCFLQCFKHANCMQVICNSDTNTTQCGTWILKNYMVISLTMAAAITFGILFHQNDDSIFQLIT